VGNFFFGGVISYVGAATVAEIVRPRISREGNANMHFSKLIARPMAAKVLKNASRWWRCGFACPENLHARHPYMQTHLPNHLWYGPSFSEMFVRRWTAQKRVNKYSNKPNGVMIAVFGGPWSRQEFGDNP
jgi:hypothetical protein